MKKKLEIRQSHARRLMQLLVLMAMLLAPKGAWAEVLGYDLWVGGVQVTADNYYHVTGNNISGEWGCVAFDANTNTLTLDGAIVTGNTDSGIPILSKLASLTIVVKGTCVLNCTDTCTAIRAEGSGDHSLTIKPASPSCSLQISGNQELGSRAIRDFSSVTLSGLVWDGDYTYQNTSKKLTMTNDPTSEVGNAKLTYQGDGLFVAGVYVTSANANDVLGDGKVSFTPAQAAQGDNPATPATLTLDNAEFQGNVIWPNSADLYVVFKGRSTINMNSDNEYFFVKSGSETTNLYFENSGKNPIPLVINNSFKKTLYDSNVWGGSSVKIDNNSNTDLGWWLNTETGTSDQIALNWIGPDLTVAGVDVTGDNTDVLGNGKVSFTAAAENDPATLTLNGATITGSIEVNNLSALKINVIGENTINAGTASAIKSNLATTACALTFSRADDGDCSLTLNSTGDPAISTGFSGPTYEALALVAEGDQVDYRSDYGLSNYANNEYTAVTTATITSYTTYDIIVAGQEVTSLNKNAIAKNQGANNSISYDDVNNVLTFNNVPWNSFNSNYPFIQTSMDLTINLVGTSEPDMGNVLIQRNAGDNETHTLTFTTDETNPGMFIVRGGTFSHEGFNVVYNNHLAKNASGYFSGLGDDPDDWVAVPKYGLTVAGVEVTDVNNDNILGDTGTPSVSFTPAAGQTPATLTLNNASITGSIEWASTEPLAIALKGESSINGGNDYCIECTAEAPTNSPAISFVKASDATVVKLAMTYKSEKEIAILGFAEPVLDNNVLFIYDNYGETEYVTTIASAVKLKVTVNGDGFVNPAPEASDDGEGVYTYGYGQTVNLEVQPSDYTVCTSITATCNNQNVALTEVDDEDFTTYSLTMPSDTVKVTANFAFDISNEDYTASITSTSYTGEALVPTTVTLTQEESDPVQLTVGTDCMLSYKVGETTVESPVDAGTYTVTITGTGNYTGTKTAQYTIAKAKISEAQFTKPQGKENLTYDGSAQQLVTEGSVPTGATIKFYSEFVPDYYDGFNLNCLADTYTYTEGVPTGTNAGYYAVLYKVDGGKNYEDVAPGQTVIVFIDSVDVKVATIAEIADQTYAGEAITPELTVTFGETPLVVGTDYTVAYTNNVNAGQATATITGKGNYKGTKTANFNIVNKTLNVNFAANQKWASFYNTTEDFNLPNTVMAYIVTKIGENSVTVSPINYVPKNVPVLLENNTQMTNVENTSADGNKLRGAGADGFAINKDYENPVYALYNNKMMRVNPGTTIPEGKCYLVVYLYDAPQLDIVLENGESLTGISGATLVNSEEKKSDLYDLQGRKVIYPKKKGLYIQKGRKVVVNNK